MEVLTAFLREHAPWPPRAAPESDSPPGLTVDEGGEPADDKPREVPALRADFQVVATVLGRRDRRHERPDYFFVLTSVDLRKAILIGAPNLSGAVLIGANLGGAYFFRADLSGAMLTEANLTGAGLVEANVSGADLSGAHLTGVDLGGCGD